MKTLIAVLFSAGLLFGQTQTKVAPDCTLGTQTFTGTGSSGNFDNRPTSSVTGIPCTIWVLVFSAQPGVTSLTINIQGAADSGGTPGSFSTLATSSGFPAAKVTYSTTTAYSPWMRVNVSAVGSAGTITAVLNGWRDDQASISGGGGGGGSGCAGTLATPCVIGGNGNGTNTVVPIGASQNAFTLSTATDVRVVTGTMGKTTYLTRLSVAWDNAATVTVRQGTTSSTPCDTSTATIDGPYGNANLTALFLDYGSNFSPLRTTSTGLDICLHLSTSVTGGGGDSFSQF